MSLWDRTGGVEVLLVFDVFLVDLLKILCVKGFRKGPLEVRLVRPYLGT